MHLEAIEEHILEGSKLIATFMNDRGILQIDYEDIARRPYNRDWEWIMPVVEKIEGLGYSFEISRKATYIRPHPRFELDLYSKVLTEENGESKIEVIFLAVVEFVKWYNKNNSK